MTFTPLEWQQRQSGREWRLLRTLPLRKQAAKKETSQARIVAVVGQDFDRQWHARIDAINGFPGDIKGPFERLEQALLWTQQRVSEEKKLRALFRELQ